MGLFPEGDPQHEAAYAEESAMVDASELIAEALEASGITQAQLARALRVSRSEITERLRGNRNITVRNLAATLHALGARLELGVKIHRRTSAPIDMDTYRRWAQPSRPEQRDRSDAARTYARQLASR